MKKLLLMFLMGVMFCCSAEAQTCPFHVKFTTEEGDCFNNAKVHFTLYDDTDTPIPMDQVHVLYPDLDLGRAYYQRSASDGKRYSAYWATELVLEPGTYIVGFEIVCQDGYGYTTLTKDTTLTLTTSYVTPTASAIARTATELEGFGRRPTLDCANTGRIQLKIENGSFPYRVTVVNHTTNDTVRQVVFDQYQYWDPIASDFLNASDPTRYDYKDYYTIEDLPAGNYDFYVVDGCGYGLPRTGQIVESIAFPVASAISIMPSEGTTSNVVTVKMKLDKKYPYYNAMLPTGARYRLSYPGLTGNGWKSVPYTATDEIVITDTISDMHGFCDIWNQTITCDYEVLSCNPRTVSRSCVLSKPSASNFKTDHFDAIDSVYEDALDPCNSQFYLHTQSYTVVYDLGDGSSNTDIRTFTKPIYWEYTDMDAHTIIKRDTISTVGVTSFLTDRDIRRIYGDFSGSPLSLNVKRELKDANGCELYSRTDAMTFQHQISPVAASWEMTHSIDNDHCNQTLRTIRVSEVHSSPVDPDGTVIRLVQSPNGNFYNFTATYSSATHTWSVETANPYNTALVYGDLNGRWLEIADYGLKTGPYSFEVNTPCSTFPLTEKIQYPDEYSVEQTVALEYACTQECSDMYIRPLAGEFSFVRRNYDLNTGAALAPVSEVLASDFRVISGPTGGYDATPIHIGGQVRISMPGTYVLRFGVSGSASSYCSSVLYAYDTLYYGGGTIEYEQALAMLCESSSTSGDVQVKAANGTAPIKYVLYSGADQTGDTLGIYVASSVDEVAHFDHVAFDHESILSCYIEDACHAFFSVNITPSIWTETQLTWFDGGVRVQTTCEGSVLSVHALTIRDYYQYHWTGPNGFSATVSDPEIFVPRGNGNGYYYVTIDNSGCSAPPKDSVYLTVIESPTLAIASDATVCPGVAVPISFTPQSSNTTGDVNFRIAVANANGITYQDLVSEAGHPLTQEIAVNVGSYVYAVSVNDGTCDYRHPEDSVRITVRSDVANSCVITAKDDSICYATTAQLMAKSTLATPYTLRWYGDYELTHLLKSENITSSSAWSTYDTAGIVAPTRLFVAVEKDGICPTRNGLSTATLLMDGSNPSVTLQCGELYHFFDDGGASANYSSTPCEQHFTSNNGATVSIRFNSFSIAENAKLYVVTGSAFDADSILYTLTKVSSVPEVITSHSDQLSLFFAPGGKAPVSGWDAYVEQTPGMAMAVPYAKDKVTLYDAVCQNQAGHYDDPYHARSWNSTISSKITNNVKKAGRYTYEFTHVGADVNGCDSTTVLVLTVDPPLHYDTAVTITSIIGSYTWHGNTYTTSGVYTDLHTTADGCDSLDVLYLTILQIDTAENKICLGDSLEVYINARVPLIPEAPDVIPQAVHIGDVLCDDGSIMSVAEFKLSDKIAKGVVFFVDSTHIHGWAVALGLAPTSPSLLVWARSVVQTQVHSLTMSTDYQTLARDFDGYGNTLHIKETAEAAADNDFVLNAPSPAFCYYYDHLTRAMGTEHKGWYMPSFGQARILYGMRWNVNQTLTKLGVSRMNDSFFVTSTEYSASAILYVHATNAGVSTMGKSTVSYQTIRAVCNF